MIKKCTVLLLVILMFTGCSDLPPGPGAPGSQSDVKNLGGQVYNPGDAIPDQYAPPWSVLGGTNHHILSTNPRVVVLRVGEHEAVLTVEARSPPNGFINKNFYVTKNGNNELRAFDQEGVRGSDWISGTASAEVIVDANSFQEGPDNFVMAWSCSRNADATSVIDKWLCGCKNPEECGFWHIQSFDLVLEEMELFVGDVNGDGVVSVIDAQQVARYVEGITAPGVTATNADVTLDDRVTEDDARYIAGCAAGGRWNCDVLQEDYAVALRTKQNLLVGDVNGDGVVNVLDAQQVLADSEGIQTPNFVYSVNADVDFDGRVTSDDASFIAACVVEKEVCDVEQRDYYATLEDPSRTFKELSDWISTGEKFGVYSWNDDWSETFTFSSLLRTDRALSFLDESGSLYELTYNVRSTKPLGFFTFIRRGQEFRSVVDLSTEKIAMENAGSPENRPPQFYLETEYSATEGEELQIVPQAIDDDGDDVSVTALRLPDGATFSESALLFSWTPALGQTGKFEAEFKADDNRGGVAKKVVTITVEESLPDVPGLV